MGQERKSFLNLAGEFAVASELNRRGVHAAVTYGTSKRADIFAMADSRDRVVRIEVKCSGQRKWLIGTRGASPPTQESSRVRWVLVHVPPPPQGVPSSDDERGRAAPRFFVLTPRQLSKILRQGAQEYGAKYFARHGRRFTGRGVPNVSLAAVEQYEGAWESILSLLAK